MLSTFQFRLAELQQMPLDFQNWLLKRKKPQQQEELSPPRAAVCQEREPLHCYLQANPHFYTFILFASCWYMTLNQGVTLKFNGRHHLFSTSELLPCSLCV